MLEIWKASAGSGKTHKLTGDYIRELLSGGTDRYKHILAVTFTNKATGEMKQRILKELNTLASGGKSPYIEELKRLERFSKVPETDREQAVRGHAAAVLSEILNDYSLFNISTIDRFFQQVLRSFALETGHFASYSVELNDSAVLTMAVDSLMNSLDDNKELLDWLINLSVEAVESGRDWNSVPQLLALGSELFKEPYKLAVRSAGSGLPGRAEIDSCGSRMRKITGDFQRDARAKADKAFAIMGGYGLDVEDFKGGSRSFMKYFEKLRSRRYEVPSASFVKMADEDSSKWCSGAGKSKAGSIAQAYADGLRDLVQEMAADDWQARLREYFTAQEILRNLTVMGILSDIEGGVRDYCRRNNLVLLSDTPKFLSDIIDGSDTPFIYEKVGCRIDNYLLDEFQDTSRMQWGNFRPLIADSVDAGHFCMAVGDVKQSIYRWRGSDWKLLDSGIEADLGAGRCRKDTLRYNWRSSAEVVRFNNAFFQSLGENGFLGGIYADAAQEIPQGGVRPPGHVRVTFVDGKSAAMGDELYMQGILNAVNTLIGNGYRPGDIAFLVRTRAEGAAMSDYLISKGFSIMTEDSLKISSSPAVRHAVDRLRQMAGTAAAQQEETNSRPQEKSLYNICEELLRSGGEAGDGGGPAFLTAFLDCVLEYVGTGGSDVTGFLEWWDTEGKDRSVSAPEGRDALRVITVHKSKGLEFKAVIVPFFQMNLSPRGNFSKYIWCSCSRPPFDMLPVYPLEYCKKLEQTYFQEEYLEEKRLSAVDAVNVAYVAFTRAEQELLVFAQTPSDSSLASSVAGLLYSHFKEEMTDNVYESGEWTRPSYDEERSGEQGNDTMDSLPSVPIGGRLRLSFPSGEFFPEGDTRMRGIVLHDILSRVTVAGDLDRAVRTAVDSGLLSRQDMPAVSERLSRMLASVEDMHWFDGTYSVMTEVPIIAPGGDNYRPDRIMCRGEEAIVVDYKFGKARDGQYRRQVLGYMNLLSTMGFSTVKGYLWYDREDGVEVVVK